jgi:predicted phosphodiesterase
MSKVLIVGDLHVTPQEIEDCGNLAKLILETVDKFNIEQVLFLGDLYHANSIVHTPAIAYWNSLFGKLSKKCDVIALVGNHDQFSHTIRAPYSLIIHSEQNERIHVIDKVSTLPILPNVCLAPYYAEPDLFFQDVTGFKLTHPDSKTLVCHQAFTQRMR